MPGIGWGAGGWGSSPWGGSSGASLRLVAAVALAENAVQLTFSLPLYYSELLDPADASQPQLYSVVPTAGSYGQDGAPARAVGVAAVAQGSVLGTRSGSVVVLTLDRPTTPSPALYAVQCAGLVDSSQTKPLNPAAAGLQFGAVFKKLVPASLAVPTGVAGRDIASPDDLAAAQASGAPPAYVPQLLGVPVPDGAGDYATDAGLVGLKKRVLRRIFFVPGVTLHLRNYGAGAASYGKRLASAANRSDLARACEAQIALEPDVAAVSVATQPSAASPGLFYLVVLVRSRSTGQSAKLLVPVTQSARPLAA
jgi:hypothetical protein